MNREQIALIVRSKGALVALAASLSGLAGAASGYLVAMKKLEMKYNEIADKEIKEAKNFYSSKFKKGDFASPEMMVASLGIDSPDEVLPSVKDAAEALVSYKADGEVIETDSDIIALVEKELAEADPIEEINARLAKMPEQVRNIFKDAEPDPTGIFDYAAEIANRSEDHPFVVSFDEFNENEEGHSQVTLTYFDGDDVLIDEKEQPIEDVENTVGMENLQKFGHGSNDSKIVYIRNERLDLDFEVVLSHGKYVEEVLGFLEHSGDTRHSSDRRDKILRFRGDDE